VNTFLRGVENHPLNIMGHRIHDAFLQGGPWGLCTLHATLSDYVSPIPIHRIAASQRNSDSKNGHFSSSIMANKDEGAGTKMERARKTGWSRGSIDSALERLSLNSTSQLVIGIDFGTTYTGVAFAHSSIGIKGTRLTSGSQSDLDAVLEKIAVIKNWPNANQQFAEKTPSVMAYENGKPVAWGGQLKRAHKTRIVCFKLGLQEGARQHYQAEDSASLLGGFINDPNWKHPDLPDKTAIDIAADYLALVGDFVINNVLKSQYGEDFLKNQQISYALTIPAIWSDKAKDATRQVAEKAGIPMDRMILITEPEAAAQYCATTCLEVNLRPGDHFLVCDAGGGTVVISRPKSVNGRISSPIKSDLWNHLRLTNVRLVQVQHVEQCISTTPLRGSYAKSLGGVPKRF
jgi:hypothetical protein